MYHPIIGLTTYGRDDQNRFSLPADYIDAVRRAGGIPLLIPPGEAQWQRLFDQLNGLILTGGGDMDPIHYQSNGHDTVYMVDPERDGTELALARHAVDVGLPTLGICRGIQVLNVALGGTLIEHLPDEVGDAVSHRLPPRDPTIHDITVHPESQVAQIMGATQVHSASWHHQAIRRPAPGLQVVAHAPDGTIEAVELPSHPWLVAVQWHPELTAVEDVTQQRLFDALVAAAQTPRMV